LYKAEEAEEFPSLFGFGLLQGIRNEWVGFEGEQEFGCIGGLGTLGLVENGLKEDRILLGNLKLGDNVEVFLGTANRFGVALDGSFPFLISRNIVPFELDQGLHNDAVARLQFRMDLYAGKQDCEDQRQKESSLHV